MPINEPATLLSGGCHCTRPVTGPGTSGVGTARGTPSTAQQGRIPIAARAYDLCDHDTWRDMQGTQFAQFSAEVLQRGAAAVLPQHLPDRWLDALLEEADLLAPEEGGPEEGDRVHESCAGLLGAVLVVLMAQRGHPDKLAVAVSTLMRCLHCYIVAL